MTTLAIDLETYSSIDLTAAGVYRYVEAPDFEILLFGYAFDDDPIQVIDLASGEEIPPKVRKAFFDDRITKTAFNAQFERTCLSKYLTMMDRKIGNPMDIKLTAEDWQCSMILALNLGMPGNLAGVAQVMKLPEDKQKMTVGKQLIQYFCKPCKPTKSNGGRTRNCPQDAPEKWETFKTYNGQDVEVERAIRKKMLRFKPPAEEQWLYVLDQEINDRGVKIDQQLVANAIRCDTQFQERKLVEAEVITGLDNPKSVAQLKKWLYEMTGQEVDSLNKKTIPDLIEKSNNPYVKQVLKLRQVMAKTSVKKYEAMQRAVCPDERVRGLLQFCGAGRTGRWAGRLVQVQNLPQNHLKDLDLARQLVRNGEFDLLELMYESVPDTLSQLIRTAFVAADGHRFIVADFSAIEARVIAWFAGEKWRQEVFSTHGKIYEASAATMFKVPIDSITKGSPLRQKGKVAELALGYQGGPGALIQMGALEMGLAEEELPELVQAWRTSNPHIVRFWYDVQDTPIRAVKGKTKVNLYKGLVFSYEAGMLFIRLPSGRHLAYVRPRIQIEEKFNRPALTYEGMNQTTHKWIRMPTYGGKLVENIVQATARDCLREAMFRLDENGYKAVMHVHDEIISETPIGFGSVDDACEIMGRPIDWAPGLLLRADGYETPYYKKD